MIESSKDKKNSVVPVSEVFSQMISRNPNDFTKIQEVIDAFSENRLLITMIFFSLPIAIPLPYPPGFPSLFAIPLIFFSFKLILGNSELKLPRNFGQYKISNKTLIMVFSKMIPVVKFLEAYVKPRMNFPHYRFTINILGYFFLIASLSILIPLPFTNAVPALSISIMSLGFINKDGLILIIGFIAFLIGILIAFLAVAASYFLVTVAIKAVFNAFRSS